MYVQQKGRLRNVYVMSRCSSLCGSFRPYEVSQLLTSSYPVSVVVGVVRAYSIAFISCPQLHMYIDRNIYYPKSRPI